MNSHTTLLGRCYYCPRLANKETGVREVKYHAHGHTCLDRAKF